ncbi:MAG: hypothetical protein U0P45_17155 [Acidimicrobiales bacterium]
MLVGDDGARRLGAALAWAARAGADEVDVCVPDATTAAVLARRAALFATPAGVWVADGRASVAATPAPPGTDPAPPPEAELYRPVLLEAGCEVVVEGGHLIGEVNGLEVARVVVDPESGPRVESGVGRFDREVGAMMFKELAEVDALARTVELVASIRTPGAERHPLNQLVPERWLRAVLVRRPELVGAAHLAPVGSAVPRANLKDVGVATAVGKDAEGRPLVVTCSTGVDLELVPSAADDRLAHAPDARLLLAVPGRDALPVTTELAHHLALPAEVVAIDDGWEHLAMRRAG